MRHTIRTASTALIIGILLLIPQLAFAIPAPEKIVGVNNAPVVPEFTLLTDTTGQAGLLPYFVNILLTLVTVISILFIVVAGYMFVTASGKEEQLTKAKQTLTYGVVGLLVITLRAVIVKIFFEYGRGATDPNQAINTPLAENTVQSLIQFGEVLLGVVAVLFIVIAGYFFITARGEEEQLTKAKHSIGYSIAGLMAVVLAETIVRIFYNFNPTTKVAQSNAALGIKTIVSITNFVLAFVGIIAVLMLIIAGFQYITARGEEDQVTKAKQGIMYSVIGLIVIIFAYTVVSLVLGGNV